MSKRVPASDVLRVVHLCRQLNLSLRAVQRGIKFTFQSRIPYLRLSCARYLVWMTLLLDSGAVELLYVGILQDAVAAILILLYCSGMAPVSV